VGRCPVIALYKVIKTTWDTSRDLLDKCPEISRAGLVLNVIE
jgi:hypothetical protein